MYFDRPKTVLAIPSPFGTRREDGSIYKHKIKLFRKSNKEWVNTQLAAHTEAEGLRDQHEQVLTKKPAGAQTRAGSSYSPLCSVDDFGGRAMLLRVSVP